VKKVGVGLGSIIVGCLTLILWWKYFLHIILGLAPFAGIAFGMLMLSAGIRQIEGEKIKNKAGIRSAKAKLSPEPSDNPKPRA
jgi:hypothetical protein